MEKYEYSQSDIPLESDGQKTDEVKQFAEMLRDIDARHGRTTACGIEEYEDAFDVGRDELLKGEVLNIGDYKTFLKNTVTKFDPKIIFINRHCQRRKRCKNKQN